MHYVSNQSGDKNIIWNKLHTAMIMEPDIEAVSVISEDPQDGGSVCCCYDYCIDARLQNCAVRCILHAIGCVMSDACHAE